MVTLWNNPLGAKSEVAEMEDLGWRQHSPENILVDHVRKLLAEEGCMVPGRFVWAPTQGSALAVLRPRKGVGNHGCSHFAKAIKEMGCCVWEVLPSWSEIQRTLTQLHKAVQLLAAVRRALVSNTNYLIHQAQQLIVVSFY
jgi:hypothetical protein